MCYVDIVNIIIIWGALNAGVVVVDVVGRIKRKSGGPFLCFIIHILVETFGNRTRGTFCFWGMHTGCLVGLRDCFTTRHILLPAGLVLLLMPLHLVLVTLLVGSWSKRRGRQRHDKDNDVTRKHHFMTILYIINKSDQVQGLSLWNGKLNWAAEPWTPRIWDPSIYTQSTRANHRDKVVVIRQFKGAGNSANTIWMQCFYFRALCLLFAYICYSTELCQ